MNVLRRQLIVWRKNTETNSKKIFKSMTTDNGHEFLNYDKIEISKFNEMERRTVVYYADPYSSWQKRNE